MFTMRLGFEENGEQKIVQLDGWDETMAIKVFDGDWYEFDKKVSVPPAIEQKLKEVTKELGEFFRLSKIT